MSVELHPEAHALSGLRIAGEEGREYTATTFPRDPRGGCEHFIRMCSKVGWLVPIDGSYAVIDVINAEGDIVQDFGVRDARAFQQIKRRLKWAVVRGEGDSPE